MNDIAYSTAGSYPPGPLRNDPEYVAYLEQRISVLEQRLPKTNLLSPRFLTRAFAVVGHYFVAGLIIELVVFAGLGLLFGLGLGVAALFHLG